ncbi:MAG: hypothetical protein IKI02_08675 [Oscillospiraceae bacterium]|nr:hypothetical protein [Oscillospiraceae bacterium]
MDYRPLLERLTDGRFRKLRLSQKMLRQLLKHTGFLSALPATLGAKRCCCAEVLSWCRPVMDSLCPPPEAGWLRECYDELAHRLFPDPGRGTLTGPPAQATEFFLTVLDYFLETEAGRCPEDPLSDIPTLSEADQEGSLIWEEYPLFCKAVRNSRFVTLMRLGRETMPFDPASHPIGVHNLALHIARQAKQAGLPVDIPLVAAASLTHDIGKFGCRGRDAARIPYLHYYFTDKWLCEQGLPKIAHIAANHSTWDLEFENLSLESLILIYADFRVRGTRENGRELVRIYDLRESYDMIFSKLYNMTPEKQLRYKTVYYKLQDFERLLIHRGVRTELSEQSLNPQVMPNAALLSDRESLEALCELTLENNIRLMHAMSRDVSFGQLLDRARSEKNLHRIRTYLQLFEEFSTYMTVANKRRTLELLYELLSHHQGDVRRRSARIMGQILANSGPRYRKEVPASAPRRAVAPATAELLGESVELWEHYTEICLHPDYKIAAKHATRISNSLKIIARSLFESCAPEEIPSYLEPLLQRLSTERGEALFALIDGLYYLPLNSLSRDRLDSLTETLLACLPGAEEPLRVIILRRIKQLWPALEAEKQADILSRLQRLLPESPGSAEQYLLSHLRKEGLPELMISELYLRNLKTAVHWIVKLTQVDALTEEALAHPENAFHTAMHLSNLLSVSEHLPVRERAGKSLLRLADLLPLDQQNEIIVDLLRELETGQDEISVFIPDYLGKLISKLPDKELSECLDYLRDLIRASTVRTATASLLTLSRLLPELPESQSARADEILGILLAGVSHYNDTIHETALTVLCERVLAAPGLSDSRRQDFCVRSGKKLLCLLKEKRQGEYTRFTQTAVLNHLYRFLVRCRVLELPFPYPKPRPVAFFPGTFDPFTSGHKRIVAELGRHGFEVYLAIDEFSWSKQPVAKLMRRQIASMSVADLAGVFLFPDEIPVNIAYPQDLKILSALFGERTLYLVTGSDVIANASAYRKEEAGSARDYNHIVFLRDGADAELIDQRIRGKRLILSLPEFYESVSSTRIREYVDQNMDISMLVDPMVQSYIFEHNLYLRAQQFKQTLQARDFRMDFHREEDRYSASLLASMDGRLLAGAAGETVRGDCFYRLTGSAEAADFLRTRTSGRVLLLCSIHAQQPWQVQLMLNELLVRSLSFDHTYSVCRQDLHPSLPALLPQFGFLPVADAPGLWYVDMRTPVVLVQDVLRRFKEPHRSDPVLLETVAGTRKKLRLSLTALYPGKLLLTFDALLLDQVITELVRTANGVAGLPAEDRSLGPFMCVPFGNILSGEIVPNTVTKSLHLDKALLDGSRRYRIRPMPGYSDLEVQVRTLAAFHRSLILTNDLLHKSHRLRRLLEIFSQERLEIQEVIVGILSGTGQDLMAQRGCRVEAAYHIPNLLHWFNESQLYPFIGGDSADSAPAGDGPLPTANLILPYYYPNHLRGVGEDKIAALSLCALENARDILSAMEIRHQSIFGTPLTIRRLAEAFLVPRVPYRSSDLRYRSDSLPSAYVRDDIALFRRLRPEEGANPADRSDESAL